MTQEALKLALEALEPDVYRAEWAVEQDREKAITAIKAALAQPAQQEPVAFLVDDDLYYPEEIDWETLQEQGHTVAALYTSPPAQRTWIGLTDEEITDIWAGTSPYYHEDDFARAIEAKLKEKNT